MTDRLPSARALSRPQESWRARLVRSLLYGRNVDRAAKARARVGFVMLAFVAIYAVIGGRLVMFATGTDSHSARRGGSQDAIATARPPANAGKSFVWIESGDVKMFNSPVTNTRTYIRNSSSPGVMKFDLYDYGTSPGKLCAWVPMAPRTSISPRESRAMSLRGQRDAMQPAAQVKQIKPPY